MLESPRAHQLYASPVVVLMAASAALLLGVSGLAVVGWVAVYEVSHVRTAEGTCLRFWPRLCTDLSADYLADVSGLEIANSSEVLDSSAGPNPDNWGFGATVLLPRGVTPPLTGNDVT